MDARRRAGGIVKYQRPAIEKRVEVTGPVIVGVPAVS
jgi:hypothetical protein